MPELVLLHELPRRARRQPAGRRRSTRSASSSSTATAARAPTSPIRRSSSPAVSVHLQRAVLRRHRPRAAQQPAVHRQRDELLERRRAPRDQGRLRVLPQPADRRQLAVADDYVFNADFLTDAAGAPVLDATGRFDPGLRPRRVVARLLPGDPRRDAEHRQQLALRPGSLGDQQPLVGRPRRALRARQGGLDRRHHQRQHQPHRAAPRRCATTSTGDGSHVVHVTYGQYSGPLQRGAGRRQQPGRQPGRHLQRSTRARPARARTSRPGFEPRRTTRSRPDNASVIDADREHLHRPATEVAADPRVLDVVRRQPRPAAGLRRSRATSAARPPT